MSGQSGALLTLDYKIPEQHRPLKPLSEGLVLTSSDGSLCLNMHMFRSSRLPDQGFVPCKQHGLEEASVASHPIYHRRRQTGSGRDVSAGRVIY